MTGRLKAMDRDLLEELREVQRGCPEATEFSELREKCIEDAENGRVLARWRLVALPVALVITVNSKAIRQEAYNMSPT